MYSPDFSRRVVGEDQSCSSGVVALVGEPRETEAPCVPREGFGQRGSPCPECNARCGHSAPAQPGSPGRNLQAQVQTSSRPAAGSRRQFCLP